MSMNPINLKPKESGGKGGLWGKIAGGIAGAIAAPFTGGASLAAVPALMGAGATVGGLVGSAIDPYEVKQPTGVSSLENYMKVDTDAQIAALKNAQSLVLQDPNMDGPTKEGLNSYLAQSLEKLKNVR